MADRIIKSTMSIRNDKGSADYHLLVTILVLLAFGLIMVFSASSASAFSQYGDSLFFVKKQLIWAAVGLPIMIFMSNFDYRYLSKFSLISLVVSFVLLIVVLVPGIGVVSNGARRWIGAGSLTFQPSEIAKLSLILFYANSLSKNHKSLQYFWVGFVPYLVILGLFAGLVIMEPHLSGMLLLILTAMVILFAAGAKISHFVLLAFPAIAGLWAMIALAPYRMQRVASFLNPFNDPLDNGWQIVQSLYAIGSGGLFGVGLGKSRQKFLYLPEPHNDFIFSVLCEELGLVGALLVIGLFMFLIWRGMKVASSASDLFGSLLAVGITSLVGIQAFLNIAVVTSSVPNTGIPLPFFSAGGSALVFTLAGMGILLNISKGR